MPDNRKKGRKRHQEMPQLNQENIMSESANETPLETVPQQTEHISASLSDATPAEITDVGHPSSSASCSISDMIKLQNYRGQDDKISIENWLKLFDRLATYKKWDDSTKLLMLSNYLEDDALNWYVENSDGTWYDLRNCMIKRFGLPTVDPIIDFVTMKYDFRVGMKVYFEQKRRLGILAGLNERQVLSLMIDGLPQSLQQHFISVKPTSYIEFYNIAKTAEERSATKFDRPRKVEQVRDREKPKFEKSGLKKLSKLPPSPCRICERLGYKNRYHWAQFCRNRDRSKQAEQSKQVNMVEIENHDNDENPMLKINLND